LTDLQTFRDFGAVLYTFWGLGEGGTGGGGGGSGGGGGGVGGGGGGSIHSGVGKVLSRVKGLWTERITNVSWRKGIRNRVTMSRGRKSHDCIRQGG